MFPCFRCPFRTWQCVNTFSPKSELGLGFFGRCITINVCQHFFFLQLRLCQRKRNSRKSSTRRKPLGTCWMPLRMWVSFSYSAIDQLLYQHLFLVRYLLFQMAVSLTNLIILILASGARYQVCSWTCTHSGQPSSSSWTSGWGRRWDLGGERGQAECRTRQTYKHNWVSWA